MRKSVRLNGVVGHPCYVRWGCLVVGCLNLLQVAAQDSTAVATPHPKKTMQETEVKTVPGKARWSFKTNAVDWLLTVPNFGIEYDLSNSIYNKLTLQLSGRFNWNTPHTFAPSMVFNITEIRPEVRKYWRTDLRQGTDKPTLKERLFSRYRKKPRSWRAYYGGIYASYANFAFKFKDEGLKGTSYGVGVSFGYSIPLYSYRHHFVDMELGGSVGFAYASTTKFRLDESNNCYVPVKGSEKKGFVPLPLPTDLRVAFVYRFASIKDKYKRIDHERIQAREAEKRRRQQVKDSIRTAQALIDSLADRRKSLQKDSLRQAKALADSLKEVRRTLEKDSLRQAKALADSLKEARRTLEQDSIRLAKELKEKQEQPPIEEQTPPAEPPANEEQTPPAKPPTNEEGTPPAEAEPANEEGTPPADPPANEEGTPPAQAEPANEEGTPPAQAEPAETDPEEKPETPLY